MRHELLGIGCSENTYALFLAVVFAALHLPSAFPLVQNIVVRRFGELTLCMMRRVVLRIDKVSTGRASLASINEVKDMFLDNGRDR